MVNPLEVIDNLDDRKFLLNLLEAQEEFEEKLPELITPEEAIAQSKPPSEEDPPSSPPEYTGICANCIHPKMKGLCPCGNNGKNLCPEEVDTDLAVQPVTMHPFCTAG